MRRTLSYGRISTLALAAMTAAFAVSIASAEIAMAAETVEIKMLNKGAGHYMAFEPELVRIKPGDTVKFVMTDKGHNAVSIQGMIPEGAEPFKSKINEEIAVTPTVPGVYGFRCDPHLTLGMVGVIVVGEPANLDKAKAVKLPGKAGEVMTGLLGRL